MFFKQAEGKIITPFGNSLPFYYKIVYNEVEESCKIMFNKKEYNKIYRIKNREKIKIYNKKWREKNKEHCKEYDDAYNKKNAKLIAYKARLRRKNNPGLAKEHRKKHNAKWKNKMKKDPVFRINRNISIDIRKALNGNKAGRKWESLVGYTLKDLIKHLELLFDKNMSWKNYGSYWWIDHIKPQSLFNFTRAEDNEFKECWALDNLQPMEKIANIKKSNKY